MIPPLENLTEHPESCRWGGGTMSISVFGTNCCIWIGVPTSVNALHLPSRCSTPTPTRTTTDVTRRWIPWRPLQSTSWRRGWRNWSSSPWSWRKVGKKEVWEYSNEEVYPVSYTLYPVDRITHIWDITLFFFFNYWCDISVFLLSVQVPHFFLSLFFLSLWLWLNVLNFWANH